MEKTLISIKEIPRETGIGLARIDEWIEKGVIPVRKIGKGVFVTPETLHTLKVFAPELIKQFETLKSLSQNLEKKIQANQESIQEYKTEMAIRGETNQRINLFMETLGSLLEVIYEGRIEEREYRSMQLFLKGATVKDVAQTMGVTPVTTLSDLRRCNNILFNLKPYTKLKKAHSNAERRLRGMETELELLSARLKSYQKLLPRFNEVEEKHDLDLLMTPLSQFQMSTRLTNVLKDSEIDMLGDLATLSEKQLRSFRQFGPTSIKEAKELLESNGLELETEIPWWEDFRNKCDLSKRVMAEEMQEDKPFIPHYLDNLLEDLPEDRAKELREMYENLASTARRSSRERKEYKAKNKELRDRIALLEKDLKHGDYRLSPTYDEVKIFFEKAKSCYEMKKTTGDGLLSPETPPDNLSQAITFLDHIFGQDGLTKAHQKIETLQSRITDQRKRIGKLQYQLNMEKADSALNKAMECIWKLLELVEIYRRQNSDFNKKGPLYKIFKAPENHNLEYEVIRDDLETLNLHLQERLKRAAQSEEHK